MINNIEIYIVRRTMHPNTNYPLYKSNHINQGQDYNYDN